MGRTVWHLGRWLDVERGDAGFGHGQGQDQAARYDLAQLLEGGRWQPEEAGEEDPRRPEQQQLDQAHTSQEGNQDGPAGDPVAGKGAR